MKSIVFIICLFIVSVTVNAQHYELNENSKILIKGTSTMHDWESTVENMTGHLTLAAEEDEILSIDALQFDIEVESIESGKKKMNKLTYEAFSSDEHPQITFEMTSLKSLKDGQATVLGQLRMAGATREVEISGVIKNTNDGVEIVASHVINMEQFGMERPTAMLGAIKVGPEVTVDFNLVFKTNTND
jgi:polyisoprenoid-binding protein YceI